MLNSTNTIDNPYSIYSRYKGTRVILDNKFYIGNNLKQLTNDNKSETAKCHPTKIIFIISKKLEMYTYITVLFFIIFQRETGLN